MNSEQFKFLSSNGRHSVSGWIFWPEEGKIKGVVQIAHGMKEYFLRYNEITRYLVEHGYVVCGNDHLGQGYSTLGKAGYMGKNSTYKNIVADMHYVYKTVSKRFASVPYFMLGHSMGSFLVRFYVTKWGYELDGVLLSGTGDAGFFTRRLYRVAILACDIMVKFKGYDAAGRFYEDFSSGVFAKRIGAVTTKADWQTRDEQKVLEFINDPLCNFVFTYQGYGDLLRLINAVSGNKWLDKLPKKLPVYMFSGDMDPVGLYGKSIKTLYRRVKAAGFTKVTLHLYKGARHEMFNEINRSEVFEQVLRWLDYETVYNTRYM